MRLAFLSTDSDLELERPQFTTFKGTLQIRLKGLRPAPSYRLNEVLALKKLALSVWKGLISHHVPFDDLQTRFVRVKNRYDILQVEQSEVARSRQLDFDLAKCKELAPENRFQKAFDLLGTAYRKWQLSRDGRRQMRSLRHPDVSKELWNEICYWLKRRMGPIPAGLLETDALDGLSHVLEGGWRSPDSHLLQGWGSK